MVAGAQARLEVPSITDLNGRPVVLAFLSQLLNISVTKTCVRALHLGRMLAKDLVGTDVITTAELLQKNRAPLACREYLQLLPVF